MVERNAALIKMYAGGESSGTISKNIATESWGNAVLDNGGNGPSGPNIRGNDGEGGGGSGDNSNGGSGGDSRRITSD